MWLDSGMSSLRRPVKILRTLLMAVIAVVTHFVLGGSLEVQPRMLQLTPGLPGRLSFKPIVKRLLVSHLKMTSETKLRSLI